ncbi:MAG: acyl-CoA/acyl-ACP dehydrogenase [Dehalococcoidia bacterium]|nr:acyl-CoA/acyl-ACP dehydrogenase [Dehalococcoidia bacterium]
MDFSMSEEQEMLKKQARDFLEAECPESVVREVEKGDKGYSPELWRKTADLGWTGLVYPEKYGGTGGSFLDLAVLHEEMGRAMFPSPHLSTTVLCGMTILAAGSEDQKADFLPKIINGELILALALAEPESSWDGKAWDAEGVTVRAAADGDDYVIDGTKLFVHDAHIADYLLCVTRTADGAAPEDNITLFLVDAKSPGIRYTLLRTTAGDKQSKVVFDKVRVPKNNMVGELNGGWSPLAKVLQQGTVLLCAQMVGAGQRVLELAVDHAKTRIQFEQPIGINQYVQEHCVFLLSEVDASRWVTYQAAWRLSEGRSCDMEVAIAKAWTSDAIERACWYAHQVLSGVGYTVDDGILPLYSRRAKSAQLYLGDTAHHLEKIAQQVDNWPAPEMPRGKPLGLWKEADETRIPDWFERFAKR